MVNWSVVAAFCGPLIAAIIGVASWFAYIGRKRDVRVAQQIKEGTAEIAAVTTKLDARITQVEVSLVNQTRHLDKQDEALQVALQGVARIEGRLAGPFQITTTSPMKEGA